MDCNATTATTFGYSTVEGSTSYDGVVIFTKGTTKGSQNERCENLFKRLVIYKKEYSNESANVLKSYAVVDRKFATWVMNQRT